MKDNKASGTPSVNWNEVVIEALCWGWIDGVKKSLDDETFDGIISSMTMHHVKDIKAMFAKFYSLLNEGGFIAISDLDKEDGSFHTEDTGVHHLGFKRDLIAEATTQVGFRDVETTDASVIKKPQGEFSVFLLTAKK